MEADAIRLLGIEYVWGAKPLIENWPPTKTDCSGLTKILNARRGIKCPHGSRYQHRVSLTVIDPRPGDLGFFARKEKITSDNPFGIYHVGMLFPDGKVIEARAMDRRGRYGNVIYRPRINWERYGPFRLAGGWRRLNSLTEAR